ncbi:MAG TPA: hypothetical protein VNY80_09975 [Steroidobacteraceae bacterium]|jgi:hypothetical protein|nr:hypothetical protein [Steroidobacteraceae bacterium]
MNGTIGLRSKNAVVIRGTLTDMETEGYRVMRQQKLESVADIEIPLRTPEAVEAAETAGMPIPNSHPAALPVAGSRTETDGAGASEIRPSDFSSGDRMVRIVEADGAESWIRIEEPAAPVVPPSWTKGQLLNVRNRGEFYVVTLLGEEDEPPLKPAPSGALRFTNTPLCQDFISRWYARESHDPRAR